VLGDLYESVIVAGVHRASSIKVAEAAKVIENTQRDLNIALMNELALIFDRIGIDTLEVLQAAGTKWNFLPFRPGLVGGHCIGVDPYYLTHKAEALGYHPQVILAGRRINDGMAAWVAQQTVKNMIRSGSQVKGAKVIVLGLTFKEDCPDLRNSKVADLVKELQSFGCDVSVHDPIAENHEAEHEYGISLTAWDKLPGQADAKLQFKTRYDNFIGGQWVAPVKGQYFDVVTPITGQKYTQAARSTAEDIELALDAAHAAFPKWGKADATTRSNILLKIADRLEANLELLAYAETVDNGKPIRETLNADIPLAVDHFRYFAGCLRSQEGGISEIDENTMAYHIHEPLGVVGQIIPWNFPILMAAWKLAPALGAGNCVVLKPAESTPISILVLMELIADLLPPGVLNIVNGYGREAGMPLATPITSETCAGARTRPFCSNMTTLRRMPVSKHSHSGMMPNGVITSENALIFSTATQASSQASSAPIRRAASASTCPACSSRNAASATSWPSTAPTSPPSSAAATCATSTRAARSSRRRSSRRPSSSRSWAT